MTVILPTTFLWGVATAGHQTDGGDTTSDTSFLETVVPTVFQAPSGTACNTWELWETDLDLARDLGLNCFRFSIEWARVEPVDGEISEEALAYYSRFVDGCIERGLAPVITLSHFTSPHWFAKTGSWLDEHAPERFARFVRAVLERVGDRVAAIVTFNEPNLPEMLTWSDLPAFVVELERATLGAASTAAGVERYRTGNVMVPEDFAGMQAGMTAAHLAAKAVAREVAPTVPIGLSISIADDVALPGGEAIRDRKRAEAYDFWLRLASEDDFVGVQNYERLVYDVHGLAAPDAGVALNEQGSAVAPDSLRGAIEYAHAVSGVPVFVTEHGISTADDALRAGMIEPALDGVQQAIAVGVPVIGYCHWTLLDNFEWIFGYTRSLGLHWVDRTTFERTPKPSASVFAAAVAARR